MQRYILHNLSLLTSQLIQTAAATVRQVDLQVQICAEVKEVTVAETAVTVERAEVEIAVVAVAAVQAVAVQVVQEHVSKQIFVEYFNKKL